MRGHDDVGALYDRWVTSWTPWGWYTRWYLKHQRPIDLPDLLGAMPPGPHARFLDVGCACGIYLEGAYAAGHGREVLAGVDLSGKQLEIAAKRLERLVEPGTGLRLVKASGCEMPFEDATFDAVISSAMIKYLDADGLRAFVRETVRVLRPGGSFAMGEFGRPVGMLGRPAMGAMGVPVDRFRTGEQQAAVLGECGLLAVRAMGMARVRRIPMTIEGASGRRPD